MVDRSGAAAAGDASVTIANSASPSWAFVTPSYFRDVERCRLLVESVERYVPETVQHYIVIDRRDQRLFAPLRTRRTHLVVKEDVLPAWLWQVPFARDWWLSARSLPVRGWIIQQLTKLSVSSAVKTDVYAMMDSGVFFVRPFDPSGLIRDGRVPLFREKKEEVRVANNIRWHQHAARLLGLPVQSSYDTSFVSPIVYWRRENLDKLQRHIENVTGDPWLVSLCRSVTMSEHVLYGMFAEHVLGDSAGHYFYSDLQCLPHWGEEAISEAELGQMKAELYPEAVAVMINEKAHMSLDQVRRTFL
jgi:hypothetical protein